MKKIFTLSLLRIIALVVVVAGAGISLALVLRAGRHNHSVLLPVLFVGWVLSPFMGLLVANVVSKRWPVNIRVVLYSLMLFLTVGSLVSYAGVLNPSGAKLTGIFLVVPLLSWLLILIVISIAKNSYSKTKISNPKK
jgi:hypothetical protein